MHQNSSKEYLTEIFKLKYFKDTELEKTKEKKKWNQIMLYVGRDLKDDLVPTSLQWAGTLSTRPHCPKPHPPWS